MFRKLRGRFGCEGHLLFALPCTRCQAGFFFFILPHQACITRQALHMFGVFSRARGLGGDTNQHTYACIRPLVHY